MNNIVRSLLAVLAGLGVVSLLTEVLEFALVNAVAGARIADMATYVAIRNEPGLLAAKLAYNGLAALLGGYVTARIATGEEMAHTIIGALVKTAALIWGFTADEFASFTPMWMRVALVLSTGPAMLAGAWVRARAVRLKADTTYDVPRT